jgi:hypothetical protein
MGRNGADWEADFGAAIAVFEGVVVSIGAGDDFAAGEKFSFNCRLRSRAFLGAMMVAVRDVGLKASNLVACVVLTKRVLLSLSHPFHLVAMPKVAK